MSPHSSDAARTPDPDNAGDRALAMVVHLTHRSQRLSDRVIARLDRLEEGEADPDRLAELFELDHLITQMRRHEEDLLVLAGARSARVRRAPVALSDVLRAAQSEIEQYTRVEFGPVDRSVEVVAPAAVDLVHLVAELLDNATRFSPPHLPVIVGARDRGTVTVQDSGSGIKPDELRDLNERLADPQRLDPAALGLAVAARLAARHGVRVVLRPAAGGTGTVAELTLPGDLLVTRPDDAPPLDVRRRAVRRPPVVPPVPLADQVRAAVAAAERTPPERLETDADGDIGIRAGAAMVFVRVRDNPPLVEVFSPLVTGVEPAGPLHSRLSEITTRLPIGRLFH
ncbi:MAG: ATP-binding protein, partial [Actinoplanes sp.]